MKKLSIFMRIVKGIALILIVLIILWVAFYLFWLYPRYTVPILTYHDFGYRKGILVTPENFERQMRYLKIKGFNVISLDELAEGINHKTKFEHNTVVITMDDGYEDNFTYAYPILQKNGFPATIFLITNNIGAEPNFLDWNQVKEMSAHNISFGAHTKNHVYLPIIENEKELWEEIAESKKAIEGRLKKPADFFCYPIGGFTKEAEMLVKKAGYKGACTTNRGVDVLNRKNIYELDRISVRNSDPFFSFSNLLKPLSFRAKLSGYYNIFRGKKGGADEQYH